MKVGRPGTAGGSNKLTLAVYWRSWTGLVVDLAGKAKQNEAEQMPGERLIRIERKDARIVAGGIEFGSVKAMKMKADSWLRTGPVERFKAEATTL